MATEAPAKTRRVELPADLLDRVEEARGRQPRNEWLTAAIQAKLDTDADETAYVDLDAIPPRQTVKFRGNAYEIRDLGEFGILDQQRLNRDGKEFNALWTSEDELTDEQGARMVMLLDRLFNRIVDAPESVRADFKDAERSRVVLAFTYAPARQLAQLMQILQAGNGSGTTS